MLADCNRHHLEHMYDPPKKCRMMYANRETFCWDCRSSELISDVEKAIGVLNDQAPAPA